VLPALRERSIPTATLLEGATPSALTADAVTVTFAHGAEFHRSRLDDPKTNAMVRDALFEVTGKRLAIVTEIAAAHTGGDASSDEPMGEDELLSLLKDEFNATEVEETT
jgi:hypothetical protein